MGTIGDVLKESRQRGKGRGKQIVPHFWIPQVIHQKYLGLETSSQPLPVKMKDDNKIKIKTFQKQEFDTKNKQQISKQTRSGET